MKSSLFLLFILSFFGAAMAAYNVVDFGAKPDGRTDSATSFVAAWSVACAASKPATVVVPKGQFFVSEALFKGPCNNSNLRLFIQGTVLADTGYSSAERWITFQYVQGLSVYGGAFDGRGQSLWACKAAGRSCPTGSTALTISQSKNVLLSGVKVLNGENFQMGIIFSQGISVAGAAITAPDGSPNTDGIHVHKSSGVSITGSTIRTGDDCISLGEGVADVWIETINCGPGHGISIGSLGAGPGEAGVQNVTVSSVVFTGTQNGFRVKTWATPYTGFVRDVTFQHATMTSVQNPIVIDQEYCPGDTNCPNQSSGVKISGVSFIDVHGTSTMPVAVKLDCSSSNPCQGIQLRDIKLSYAGKNQQVAQSFCKNAKGMSSGSVDPPSCL